MDNWWATCPFSRVSPPRVVREMGYWPQHVDTLPRQRKKHFGDLYLLLHESKVFQANLYIPEAEGLTIEDLEARVRHCPLLAAGSLQVPLKPPGGHLSTYTIKFRTVLNFSVILGLSMHGGDKEDKKDTRSDIHHAWVDLNCDGLESISDKRIAIYLMCILVGYSYTPPDSKWHTPFEACDEYTITPIRPAAGGATPAAGGVSPAAGYPPLSISGASSSSAGQGALHAGSRSAGSSSQAEVPPPRPDRPFPIGGSPPAVPPLPAHAFQPLAASEALRAGTSGAHGPLCSPPILPIARSRSRSKSSNLDIISISSSESRQRGVRRSIGRLDRPPPARSSRLGASAAIRCEEVREARSPGLVDSAAALLPPPPVEGPVTHPFSGLLASASWAGGLRAPAPPGRRPEGRCWRAGQVERRMPGFPRALRGGPP